MDELIAVKVALKHLPNNLHRHGKNVCTQSQMHKHVKYMAFYVIVKFCSCL